MILKYTKTNTPYIEFDNGAKFIFSATTKDDIKGYKYLCFSHSEVKSICISGAKAKNKRYASVFEPISFVTTMQFEKIPNEGKKVLTSITLSWLKKTFEGLISGDYFPEKNLKLLSQKLNIVDDTDDWDDDPTATESFDEDPKDVKRKLKKANGKPLKIKIKPKISFNRKEK